MGWSKKKTDPISEREQALSAEIAALEAQIKRLDTKSSAAHSQPPASAPPAPAASSPRLRSTTLPQGVNVPASATPGEPIFEEVSQSRLKGKSDAEIAPEQFNDLGMRKYDLAALWHRIKNHFRGPPTTNPKLVNYLAAGSIQGLRPMRYEKRVARNRFLFVVIIVLVVLTGIFAFIRNHH